MSLLMEPLVKISKGKSEGVAQGALMMALFLARLFLMAA
jgi:hypothetical protein